MDTRIINERYAEIGQELIDSEPELSYIKDLDISIIYLSSEHEKKHKGKNVLGQCEKIQEKYKWGIPCDFTITVFEPNVEGMTTDQIKILLFHELLHIGEDGNIRPHDLEDFKYIIDRFGTDWSEV
jgi:predicted metallopeptidase